MLTTKLERTHPCGRPLMSGTLALSASEPPFGDCEPIVPRTPIDPSEPFEPFEPFPVPLPLPLPFPPPVAAGTVTTTVFVVFIVGMPPPYGLPVTVAVFDTEPALWSAGVIRCVHVFLAVAPGARGPSRPPLVVPGSQRGSVKLLSVTNSAPMLWTRIWYSIVCPTSPLSGVVT